MKFERVVLTLAFHIWHICAFKTEWYKQHEVNKEETLIALRACAIAKSVKTQLNLLYTSGRSATTSMHLEQQLFSCVASMPVYTLDIGKQAHELYRHHNSLSFFIIAGTNEQALARVRAITDFLNAKQRLKHNHHYVYIWKGATMPQLRYLFERVWQKGILHAVVLTASQQIYTYEPFTAHGFSVKPVTHGRYFYDKLANLHHYQLRISMFPDMLRAQPKPNTTENGYDAVDGIVADTIVRKLNATARYYAPDDNNSYGACRNGSFTGVLKQLIPGETHIHFNSRFVLECMRPHLELLYPYYQRTLYLIVPAADLLPEYLIFVNAFTNNLWRLLLLNFLLVVAVFYALKRCANSISSAQSDRKHYRWYEILELVFKTQLGEPVDGFAKINSLRQFLICWIFFSYILTSVYFAKLESSFARPLYEDNLDRLDDLERLNVPIYAINNLLDAVKNALEPRHWAYINASAIILPLRYTSCKYALPISRRLKRVAFILRHENAREFIVDSYNIELNRPRFHIVNEPLRTFPQTFILTRGSPFANRIERCLHAFFEFGLMHHWTYRNLSASGMQRHVDDIHYELPSDGQVGGRDDTGDGEQEKVALSIEILQGAFWLWVFGIIFSVIGFGLEHAYFAWQRA